MKKRYKGFISYNQLDKKIARRIHKTLDTYCIPRGITPTDAATRRLGRFFIDDEEMGAATDLSSSIKGNIEDSESMFVICSPRSAVSKWVDLEIRHFKARNRNNNIYGVIVDGIPDSKNPETECFPESLKCEIAPNGTLTEVPTIPLAVDIRRVSYRRVIAKLVSALLKIPFDNLWQRELRRQRQKRFILISVVLLICTAIVVGGLNLRRAKIEQFRAESFIYSRKSQEAADISAPEDSLRFALKALPSQQSNLLRYPILPEAVSALRRAMSIQNKKIIVKSDSSFTNVRFVANGILAAEHDNEDILLFDLEKGNEIGKIVSPGPVNLKNINWTNTLDVNSLRKNGELFFQVQVMEDYNETNTQTVFHITLLVWNAASGKRVETRTFKVTEWNPIDLDISPSGNLLLMESVTSPVRLGLFEWRKAQDSQRLIPQKIGIVPDIQQNDYLRYAFADENTIAYTWDVDGAAGERKGIGIWRVQNEKGVTLAHPLSEASCKPVQTDKIVELKDNKSAVSMAYDRSAVVIQRPLPGKGWCVDRWALPDGEPLSPIFIPERNIISAVPFSRNWTFVKTRPYFSIHGLVYDPMGKSISIEECESNLLDLLYPVILGAKTVANTQKDYLACVGRDNQVFEFYPMSNGVGVPLGRQEGAINAVAYDPERHILVSAGADGNLIQWENQSKGKHILSVSEASEISSDYGRTSVFFNNGTIGVYDVTGERLGPIIPVKRDYNFHTIFAAGGQTLLVFTGEQEKISIYDPEGEKLTTPQNSVFLYRVADGELLTQLDDLSLGGFFDDPWPTNFSMDYDHRRGIFILYSGDAIELDLLTGKKLRHISADEGQINDVAYQEGEGLWLLVSDGNEEPSERKMTLLFENTRGERKKSLSEQAQDGKLYSSQDTRALVAVFDARYSQTKKIIAKAFYGLDQSIDLPSLDFTDGTITFGRNNERIVFLKKDYPLVIFDANTKKAQTILPRLEAYASDTWRVNDPKGRIFVSTDDDRLTMVPLDEGGVCPALNRIKADAAAFSNDGRYFATSSSDETVVYDLLSCTPVFKRPGGVLRNNEILFPDAHHLWFLLNNRIAIIDLDYDLAALRKRAEEMMLNQK